MCHPQGPPGAAQGLDILQSACELYGGLITGKPKGQYHPLRRGGEGPALDTVLEGPLLSAKQSQGDQSDKLEVLALLCSSNARTDGLYYSCLGE